MPDHELGEIKNMLGESIVDQSLELHDEVMLTFIIINLENLDNKKYTIELKKIELNGLIMADRMVYKTVISQRPIYIKCKFGMNECKN